MELSKFVSISGKSGLFEIISQATNHMIVESIEDGKRIPVYNSHKVSILEDISFFTNEDDMPLKEVFEKIHAFENGMSTIDHKADKKELADRLKQIIPNYDDTRVYHSDMKKLFNWYNLLISANKWEVKSDDEEGKEESKNADQEGKIEEELQ